MAASSTRASTCMGRWWSGTAARSAPRRCSATASCYPERRSRRVPWSWAASTAGRPSGLWASPYRGSYAELEEQPDLRLQLPDHVVGPGVVTQALLVADDLLAVRPLERDPRGGLQALRGHLEAGAIPDRRLLLDLDPAAAGLVLEGVELVGGDGEHELAGQAARLLLAHHVRRAVGEGPDLRLRDRHLRPGAGGAEGADGEHLTVHVRLDGGPVLPAPFLRHLGAD